MNDFIALLKDFGFPVFVAVVLLLRIEPVVKENTKAMIALGEIIRKCTKP